MVQNTKSPFEGMNAKQLLKLQSDYTAVQIVQLIAATSSLSGIGMLAYFFMTLGESNFFAILVIIFNLPFCILMFMRSKAAHIFGYFYVLPLIPCILGIVALIKWPSAGRYFGKDRITIREVNEVIEGMHV